MLARSVRNPLLIGLGTGAVLVLGTAPPVLAVDETPSQQTSGSQTASSSPTGSLSPPPPALYVTLSRTSKGAIHAGDTVSFVAHVKSGTTPVDGVELALGVDQHATVDARCVMDVNSCVVGPVDKNGQDVDFTVSIYSKMASGTVHVKAKAFSDADNNYVKGLADPYPIKVTKAPTTKPSKSPSPTASHSSSAGSSSGSSGSSGSSSSNSSPTPTDLSSGANDKAPSVAPQNNAVLPGINQQNPGQTPSTAPLVQPAGNSQSMSGSPERPDELTFDKLASTQAAWLAALLVAFSLLLTQVRLGKANARAARPAKPKGAHRRTRRRRRPGSRAL